MRNVNRVILAGNLTRDPEFRQLPSDTPVANFGLAVNRRYKDRQGNLQEETVFVECETYGRQAEVLHQYARKGRGLFVEGRLRLDQWQNKEGQNRSKIKVVVENFQFTDARGEGEHGEGEGEHAHRPTTTDVEDLLPF